MIRGISAPRFLSLRLGIKVGSTKQPTLATCSASPLIGRREAALWLFCASASSGGFGSEVAWLWTALLPWKLHPPSLLSPSSQSSPREQRNRGDRGGRENWPGAGRAFLPCPAFPLQHPTEKPAAPSLSPGPWRGSLILHPAHSYPCHLGVGGPWPSLLERGMELIKISLTAQP